MNGLAYGNFEWMAAFTLIVLSLFFVPFYIRAKVTTLPDFLEKRYNGACRDMLAVISVFSAIITVICFNKLGSWQELVANVEPVKMTVIRPHGDSSGLPWYAVLLG